MTDMMPGAVDAAAPLDRARGGKHRAQILDALQICFTPVSAQSLYAPIRSDRAGIGLSTVYRELHALVSAGRVQAVHRNNEALYRLAAQDLLMCDECGRSEPLRSTNLAALHSVFGTFFPNHTCLTVHGTCAACQADGQRFGPAANHDAA